jgi:DNA repair and recombination protein RAD54 and RAD54-like protein
MPCQGKTLQSVTLIWTLLRTGITANGAPTAKRVIVVCPCSLVKNWDNEFSKWLGPGTVKTLPIAEADRKKVEKDLDAFGKLNLFDVLICSYECLRTHAKRLTKYPNCCDLLVCDEAHRLKNNDNQTSRALDSLPVKRRVLLTGTPMQNDLQEFYAMVNFTNPGVLGTQDEFRKNMLFPILRGREPDATESQKNKMNTIQEEMSGIVNQFILRRINTLNAQHLPPKLVQVVCCNLTEIQQNMYQHLITSKDMQHVMDGKQVNCLGSIQMLMKLCNHPSLVVEEDQSSGNKTQSGRRAAAMRVNYNDTDETTFAAPGADGIAKFLPCSTTGGGRAGVGPVHPEWSGKMFVLYRLMKEMRKPGNGSDKIVIVSNYTQTLDLIGLMCRENSWGFCRLDGSISMKKRQKMVDEFNDPGSSLVAFLLSSKAGGCGLNLIGGNRLVLFDPDWNPAVDKQAAARCWRDGQKKRCFTYRFLATGTVEEKIFQRQLSKEGLQSVVDDKEQVNALSTKDLRNLFKLRTGTPSDTHDKLRCERCRIIQDNAEMEAKKVLPLQLAACLELLEEMMAHEDAQYFIKPLVSQDHGVSKEDFEKVVKQPIDLGIIQSRLKMVQEGAQSYKNISSVSKDVNRIFSNVMKVWSPGDDIADAARRLQSWWIEKWTAIVPRLMTMKPEQENADGNEGCPLADVLDGCATFNNERGDDYQEQIGMPDEENMRHWSHHHSTDTVDDPVFRAAMRATDSVSFVFGLEVTWSLIQQRKQDEDDRKAMEAIQEAEEGEFVCAVEAAGEEQDEGDEVSDNHGVAEGMQVDNSAGKEAVADSSSDESSEVVLQLQTDENSSPICQISEVVNAPDAPTNLASKNDPFHGQSEGDVSVVEIDMVGSQQSCSQRSSTSSQYSPASNEWQCPSCTLFNKKSLRKCGACSTRRPKAGMKRPLIEIVA